MNNAITKFSEAVHRFFNKGHSRTLKAKKEIILSYIYQGIDVFLGFLLIPLVLAYLDAERYGIWLVLFSFTAWFDFMNIGLEQGLRNKYAETIAQNEKEKAKYYVSTTYAIIALIGSVFFTIFLCVNYFLDWTKILNTSVEMKRELTILAAFVFGSFALKFVLKIITTLLVADQKPSFLYLKNLLEKVLKVIIVLALFYTTESSLLTLGILYSVVPIVILAVMSVYYFSRDLKAVRPSWDYIDFNYLRDLLGIGWKFFVIQIAVVVLLATDNIIIAQLFGPEHVTPYEISKKYFSIPLMLFVVLVQPLWSAVTDAYYKNDLDWIRRIVRKLLKIWIYFSICTFGMLFLSEPVYRFWLGTQVTIPFQLSFCWAIFVVLYSFNQIFTSFINGIGKIKLQLCTSIITIIINIPLSIYLAKWLDLGVSGVLLATIFSISISCFFRVIQYKKITSNSALGIWNK